MSPEPRKPTPWYFYGLAASIPILVLAIAIAVLEGAGVLDLRGLLVQAATEHAYTNMDPEARRDYAAALADDAPGIWDAVPDPHVGRILQANIAKRYKGAEIVSNRAGMRNHERFVPKPADTYRIVLLGDSMVMGTAGLEEDRMGEQLEAMLREVLGTVDGKTIEVYSVGIGSWTIGNAVSYLVSRFSDYRPDLVVSILVSNDFSDSAGVNGLGAVSSEFSPERRALGSGIIQDNWARFFGRKKKNLLAAGLGPESEQRWRDTFHAWQRLGEVAAVAGAKVVFAHLNGPRIINELAAFHADRYGFEAPLVRLDYLGHRLPHDAHPDREGNRILALHLAHVFADRKLLPIDREQLDPLPDGLPLYSTTVLTPERLHERQRHIADRDLGPSIRFDALDDAAFQGILGGIYPADAKRDPNPFPFGSTKVVFLLKRDVGASRLRVDIEVPPRPELFPFELLLRLNGAVRETLALGSVEEAGPQRLEVALTPDDQRALAQEVTLRTDSYFSEIEDHTMKSYRLVAATQVE
jgi:hypothetical protein